MSKEGKLYTVTSENDNSLKQLFDRFYVIPKDYSVITDADRKIIEHYNSRLVNDLVASGKNGYIVFRGKKPKKLTLQQIEEIKTDGSSTQRELAFKYDVGVATINKIKNGKY
jgi:phage terminase large subunit